MGHKPNWEEAMNVGVDKENKDYICEHDEEHGYYTESTGGKPTESKPKIMANEKKPFELVSTK